MHERNPRSMLLWISRTYDMGPTALARMFQRHPRTMSAWLKEGRIPARGSTRIRSAFYYLNNLPNPHDPMRSGIDTV